MLRRDRFEEIVRIRDGDGLVPRRIIDLNATERRGPNAVADGVEVRVHVEVDVEEMEGERTGPRARTCVRCVCVSCVCCV